MLKLTFTYKGRQWQLEGEDQQIVSFLASFPEGTIKPYTQLDSSPDASFDPPRLPSRSGTAHRTAAKIVMIDQQLPSNEEIKEYLLTKPNFAHDLFDVQKRFFGRIFTSRREEQRMYHRTIRQLREIRRAIEQEQHGKFKEIKGEIRGQKRYVFEPLQTATLVS